MAQHRHKRDTPARRPSNAALIAAPIAVIATLSAVTMGVLTTGPSTSEEDLLATTAGSATTSLPNHTALLGRRDVTVSRSQARPAASGETLAKTKERGKARRVEARATLRAVRGADTRLWTTEDLNLWNSPDENADNIGLVEALTKVLVTGRRQSDRTEIVVDGRSRWVTSTYLSATKPESGPSLGGACANGTSIDAGRASLYDIFNAVCSNWPEITSYGTWRSDGEHGQGRAMDIMVSGATGWEVANFLRANYADLGIEYLIHARNIWSVDRAGEGWRGMADRGSITANHLDHVHVTVY